MPRLNMLGETIPWIGVACLGENAGFNSGLFTGWGYWILSGKPIEGGRAMRNWRALSLVAVLVAAVFVWQMPPQPATQALMNLPPGVTLKTQDFGTQNFPGVKKVTWNRLTIAPGAKAPNMDMPSKTYDFCYELAGTMSVKGADGKVSQVKPGAVYTVAPDTKIPLLFNTGKVPAVDDFWEIEVQ
jgi:quercetin dioxygenase-like cupin family protein